MKQPGESDVKWDLERTLQAYESYLSPGKHLEGPFEGWEIQGLLGRGGMALVYLIEQSPGQTRFSGNRSVLKIIPGYLVSDFLVNEYESLRRLQSPYIVRLRTGGESLLPVDGAGVCPDIGYLELEYCPGGTLEDFRLSYGGPMPAYSAAKCMYSIFQGLQEAHRLGIGHGDICTRNILLDGGETMKISDFGLARIGENHLKGRPGRLRYFPPEAFGWRGTSFDRSWDIWACGIIYLTLISGKHPLESHSEAKCEKILKSFTESAQDPFITLPPSYQIALEKQIQMESDTLEGRVAVTIVQALRLKNRASVEVLLRQTRKALRQLAQDGEETQHETHYYRYVHEQQGRTLEATPPKIPKKKKENIAKPSEDITYLPSN
jgi:serine/threonine protein kinase